MEGPPAPDHSLEEPWSREHDGLVTVEFLAPLRTRVTAAGFELRSLGVERRPVPATPDASRCAFESTDALRLATLLGPDVVWRTYGGGAGTPTDPGGWFLQRRDRLASSLTGVFWRAVQLLGRHASRVRSGNCVFAPADWVAWVTAGTLPPVERLLNGAATPP